MSSDKVYLSKEEQYFLMDMFELDNPTDAAEKFARVIAEEKADPGKMQDYLKRIIQIAKKEGLIK